MLSLVSTLRTVNTPGSAVCPWPSSSGSAILSWWIRGFSHCCDQEATQLGKGLFWLTVQGVHPSWCRSHGTRGCFFTTQCMRQQKRSAGAQLAVSYFPMCLVWDTSQRDGAAHIQVFPQQVILYRDPLTGTPEGVLPLCLRHFFI